MLKKGDAHSQLNITKKTKQYTQPSQSYSEFNKENLCSRSLLDPLNDSHSTDHPNKQKGHDVSGNGSTLISPTFQSIPQLSLKDHLYKQDPSYINVNFSLKDVAKKGSHAADEEKYRKTLEEVEQLKQQLLDHYKSKKYWNKISALFEKEGVEAVIAWQETIDQYKRLKASKEQLEKQSQTLESELVAKDDRIAALEKQIMQDKNETRVLSQKKCKGCENLEQKQKEYQQLYGQNKKTLKQMDQVKQMSQQVKEQHRKLEEKYNNLVHVKEELEKKNGKLFEREKELAGQLQKLEKAFKEDTSTSKDLHIEIEKLKEEKYQVEKSISKNEEKHRREVADLKAELAGVEEEKNILASQSQKTKAELNEAKSRLFKVQFELESIDETLKIKAIECQDLKRRHIDSMGEELRRKNGLDDLLKNKQEQLRKAYHLIDEVENAKVSLEMELNQERKAAVDREEELAKQLDLSKDLEDRLRENEDRLRDYEERLREHEENQHRIKEASQNFAPSRNKNLSLNNFQGNAQSCSPQNNSLLVRICSKIREFYSSLSAVSQQHPDSYQKRKGRQEMSEEREQVNLLRTERYVNEIYTQFSNFRNKYEFVCKENETLKMQIENEASYKQQEAEQLQREIDLKEEALRAISSCIPEQLKEAVLEFLCLTEQLATNHDHQDDLELEEYDDLKQNLEAQAKEWKDHYQKLDRRFKKLEEEVRRLEDENEQLRRKMKVSDPKRQLVTEYDYKKDIRKKYNI